MINSEIENTKFRITHPEMGIKARTTKLPNLIWKISERDLIELATALHAAKIAYKDGREATFTEIVQFLENFFSRKKIKTLYDIKGKVIGRARSTKFLDTLKKRFLEYSDSKL